MKQYSVMENVGRARFVVNFHDGRKRHADGSEFFDVRVFRNKRKLVQFVRSLRMLGYVSV
jgi:hypothetical protein